MNINAAEVAFAWFAGVLLAAIYFGGLWWTVRHLSEQKLPWLWLMASFALRAGLAVFVFYVIVVSAPDAILPRLIAAVIGFLSVRVVMTWALGPKAMDRTTNGAEKTANS